MGVVVARCGLDEIYVFRDALWVRGRVEMDAGGALSTAQRADPAGFVRSSLDVWLRCWL